MKRSTKLLRSILALILVCMMVVSCTPGPQTDTENTTETEVKETETTVESESEEPSESLTQTESETESDTKAVTETESETEKITETETVTETEKTTETETETETETQAPSGGNAGGSTGGGTGGGGGGSVIVIPPTPHVHSWTSKVIPATCKEQGYTLHTCSCTAEEKVDYTDIDLTKHIWGEDYVADKRATCLKNGHKVLICTVCGGEQSEPEQALGHDWVDATCTAAQYCSRCDAPGEPALGHEYGETPISEKAAKCEEAGSKTYRCIHDGCQEQVVEAVAATGHQNVNWDGGIANKKVEGTTCEYVSVETGHCSSCSSEVTRESEHFFKHEEQVTITNATCVAKGEKKYTCKNCTAHERKETIEIDPTAHTWDAGTESQDGTTITFACTNGECEATKVQYTGKTATLNVKEVSAVEVGGATITPDEATKGGLADNVTLSVDTKKAEDIENIDENLKNRIRESAIYDLSMNAGGDKISKFDGKMTVRVPYKLRADEDPENIVVWFINDDGKIEEIPATYEKVGENGYAVFSTDHFSYYTVTRMEPEERCALYGHNYVGNDDVKIIVEGKEVTVKGTKVPATCVSGGYEITYCARCDDKTTNLNPTPALNHDWDVTETPATCTQAGNEHYDCKRCDVTYDKVLKATGHDWHAEEEDSDGHDGNKDRYEKPTCTKNGSHYIVCTKCSAEYKEDLPQTGHDYEDTVIEPTCDKHGYTNHKCKNQDCTDEYDSNQKPALGHIWDKWGHCSQCDKDCKHKFENGVCKHCHALANVIYPEPTDEKTVVLSEHEYGKTTLTLYYGEDGALLKVKYIDAWFYEDKATQGGGSKTVTYDVNGKIYEFYVVDGTAALDTFSAGESWIGHEISGEAKCSTIVGTMTRVFKLVEGKWVIEDETEEHKITARAEAEKSVIYFYEDSETGEITATGHIDGEEAYSIEIEEKVDPVHGNIRIETETTIVYCAVCFGEAHKTISVTVVDENDFILERDTREYIMVDGVEVCVYNNLVKGAVAESKLFEGEKYNYPLSRENIRYLVNGNRFIDTLAEYVYADNHCTATVKSTYEGETFEYEQNVGHYYGPVEFALAEGAESCMDGVVESRTCLSCGESQTNTYYHHYYIDVVETISLSESGCTHGGEIVIRECLCGQRKSAELNDDECDYSYEDASYDEAIYDEEGNVIDWIWHNVEIRTCDECHCSYSIDYYTENNDCRRIDHEIYRLNDEVILEVVADEGVEHSGRQYQYIPDESGTALVDGKLVRTKASMVYCTSCGEFLFKRIDIDSYNDAIGSLRVKNEMKDYLLRGNEFVLDQVIVNDYEIATGKYLTDYQFSYRTKQTNYYYNADGTEIVRTYGFIYQYDEDNRCSYTVYYVDANGNMSEGWREDGVHIEIARQYVLHDPEGTCLDGVDLVEICPDCGELDRYITTYGHYISKETSTGTSYALNEYGHTCGGTIDIMSCLCGAESRLSVNLPSYSTTSDREVIDGVGHNITTYACNGACSGVVVRDWWSQSDAYCNRTQYNVLDLGNGETAEFEIDQGQHHTPSMKELPEECSDVFDPITGIRTVTIAREEYCSNCKASIQKSVMVDTYNAEGFLTEEAISYYEYVAESEEVTLAVLDYTEHYTYAVAECSYDSSYIRTYPTACVTVHYDENGEEIYKETSTYSYEDGNYCYATVTVTDSDGGSWSRTEETHTNERKTVYALEEGSVYCTDGLIRYEVCYDCAYEEPTGLSYGSHCTNGDEVDRIDLADLGSVCGSEFVVYDCVCGNSKIVEFEGLCEYTLQDEYWTHDKNGVEYHFQSYACPVTDPKDCGFAYTVVSRYGSDEKCNEVSQYVYCFDTSSYEDEGVYQYEYSSATGNKRHTIVTEKVSNDTGYVKTEVCSVCSILNHKDTVDNYTYKYESYWYNDDGTLQGMNIETGLVFFDISYGRGYRAVQQLYRSESYDREGKIVWWNETRYEYPYAEDGNYCSYIVTRADMNKPEGYDVEERTNHLESWSSDDVGCVPGTEYRTHCEWCGKIEIRTDASNGHRYQFDNETGMFVCRICGLESDTGKNGEVIFADYTLTEGNGEEKYIVGYRNNFGDDYTWRVSLMIPIEGEDDYDQVILPDIKVEEVGEYRLHLDAKAIADAAKEYVGACEYMVRLTFVPGGKGSKLDFAITLDPHIPVLNKEKSKFVDDVCSEIGTLVYDCMLCAASEVEERTYGGEHSIITEYSYTWDFDDQGNQIHTEADLHKCENCDYWYKYTNVYTYAKDGTRIGSTFVHEDESGILNKSTTVYDYEAGTYTETYVRPDNTSYSYTYMIVNNQLLLRVEYDAEGNVIERYTYAYTQNGKGEYYQTLAKYESMSDDYWWQREYAYDFDKGVRTVTYTGSKSESKEVSVEDIATGNTLSRIVCDAEGKVIERYTYDYIQNGKGEYYQTLEKYESMSDDYWWQNEYAYDFDKGEKKTTYMTNKSKNKTVTVSMINYGLVLSEIEYDADEKMVESETYRYIQDNDGDFYQSFYRHEVAADNYWYQEEHVYDWENNVCTTTVTDSNGTNKVSDNPIKY